MYKKSLNFLFLFISTLCYSSLEKSPLSPTNPKKNQSEHLSEHLYVEIKEESSLLNRYKGTHFRIYIKKGVSIIGFHHDSNLNKAIEKALSFVKEKNYPPNVKDLLLTKYNEYISNDFSVHSPTTQNIPCLTSSYGQKKISILNRK
ncbi:hypothetical protein HYV11_02830 [Candidatus Dependentiae bacterium]|nr:hypothetical protein [Candidatus Dependentiae bacterium]